MFGFLLTMDVEFLFFFKHYLCVRDFISFMLVLNSVSCNIGYMQCLTIYTLTTILIHSRFTGLQFFTTVASLHREKGMKLIINCDPLGIQYAVAKKR